MEHVYTVFREDYDEHNEGHQGMWDNCFRSLAEAKAACEKEVIDIWGEISEIPIPSTWHWFDCITRNNCWILDDTETGTVHTIVQANVQGRSA